MRLLLNGYDLLEGVGANRDANATEHAPILYASTSVHPVVDEDEALALVIDNHFAPSAMTVIDIYFALGA